MKEMKKIEVMEDVCEHIGVKLQEISCLVFEGEQLHIRGSIRTQKNYQVQGDLQIRADILNEEGKIIYSMEDFQKRNTEFLYDSFELSRYGAVDVFKVFELDTCMIRIYPIIRKKMRREIDEAADIY